MSLYRLPDSVRELLRLENFEADDFSTKQFIETLSSSQAHAVSDDNLDPKPYIRTFEAVAGELQRLLEDATENEEIARKQVEELSESHNLNIIDMYSNVDSAVSEIKMLDEQISEITRATGVLGDRLERLSREHSQVTDSRQLISHYLAFLRKGSSPDLEKLWNSDETSDRRKAAQMVGQLQLLARRIGKIPTNPNVEDKVNEFAERLETHLVSVFQDAYTAFDLVGMREIAEILHDFNGGSSVVQAFVNQHDFFMQVDKLEDETTIKDETLWARLSDPKSDYPEFEQVVQSLVSEVVEMVLNETDIITQIFPKPVQVLTVFMQRVFAQRIQGQFMLYTQEAEEHSPLAQARVLFVYYERIGSMVKSLKDTWNKLRVDPDSELASMLDSNFTDTFTLFTNDDYFKTQEIPVLRETIATSFAKFFEARALGQSTLSAQSGSRDYSPDVYQTDEEEENSTLQRLDRLVKAARGKTGTTAMLNRLRERSPAANVQAEATSLLQLEDLQTVLAGFAETVGREQVLRPASEMVKDVILLFNLLMEEVCGKYINASFEDAGERAKQDVRVTINWAFLDAVKRGTNAVQLVAAFVKIVLFPMVRNIDSSHAEMAESINQYVSTAQDLASYVLEQASQLAHLRIQNSFSRQKRRDFVPKESDRISTDAPSEPCREILQMLTDLEVQARQSLTGQNLVSFLNDVAIQLHDDLLVHIKKQSINQMGGTLLTTDIEAYEYVVVNTWELTSVAESYATLRSIAKLFVVDHKLLPSLTRDSHLTKLKPGAVSEYIALRSDYHSMRMNLPFLHRVQFQA